MIDQPQKKDSPKDHINELAQQHGYTHPLSIAARLEQWIGRHGGETSASLNMYEAMNALRLLAVPVSDAAGLAVESVLVDGQAYTIPVAVSAELLRLNIKVRQPQPSGNAGELPVSAQEKEEAARYRWLRDRNDWHAEPRLDAEDGTVWRLTFYTPAPIIDPTDDDSLDVALIAAMLAGACGSPPQRPVAAAQAQPPVSQSVIDAKTVLETLCERARADKAGGHQVGGVRLGDLMAARESIAALAQQAATDTRGLTVAAARPLAINGYQLRAALEFVAPDGDADQLEQLVCIQFFPARDHDEGHDPAVLFCWLDEYPEEGGITLDEEPSSTEPAQQVSGQDREDTESRHAMKEGERNAAVDDYFKARTWIMDTTDSRHIFEAGFDRGYDARAAGRE